MEEQILRRYLISSDWHIRLLNPKNRIDFYYASQKMKVRWILRLYKELKCDALLVPGDIFDSSSSPYLCIGDYIRIFLSTRGIKFLTIFGQHDLRYHSLKSKKNTPLWSFLSALSTTTIDDNPFVDEDAGICINGASWSQQIPEIRPNFFNILLIHKLVTHSGPLWPGQKSHTYTEARTLLQNNSNYNVILSGDNHQSFRFNTDKQLLINAGTIVRNKIDLFDFKPRVGILTIYKNHSYSFDWKYIPIQSGQKVFRDISEVIQTFDELEANPELENFITSLRTHSLDKPDFVKDLRHSLTILDDKEVKDEILDILANLKQKSE